MENQKKKEKGELHNAQGINRKRGRIGPGKRKALNDHLIPKI